MQLSKNVKRTIKGILFLIVLVVLTILLDASFEFDESATEAMLTKYSRKTDLDTVFVGNSAGEIFDSDLYSSISGNRAFNMCTPSQGLMISQKNIEMACRHHKIKNVILLITPDSVDYSGYDAIEHLYDRVVDSSSPFFSRIVSIIKRNFKKSFARETVKTEKSVSIWIPWGNETNHGINNIIENLNRRTKRALDRRPLGCDIAYDLNETVYETNPADPSEEDSKLFRENLSELETLDLPEGMVAPDKLEYLNDICLFCRANGIDLKVIVTPHRSDYFDRYENFRQYNEIVDRYLNDFVSQRGFVYYNTEYDPNLHKILPDSYFYDWKHIKEEYRDIATEYLADVINRIRQNDQNQYMEEQ